MNDFEGLKEIWLSEKAEDLPNSEEVKTTVQQYHASKKRNIYYLILGVILCLIVFLFVLAFAENKHFTRTIGENLMLLGVVLTVILKLKSLKKITENELKTNQKFLEDLKTSIENKSKTNLLQLFTVLLIGVGYGFFIYQDVQEDKILMAISYSGILFFLLFMYFIFRSFTENISRKKSERLLKTIDYFKDIN